MGAAKPMAWVEHAILDSPESLVCRLLRLKLPLCKVPTPVSSPSPLQRMKTRTLIGH